MRRIFERFSGRVLLLSVQNRGPQTLSQLQTAEDEAQADSNGQEPNNIFALEEESEATTCQPTK